MEEGGFPSPTAYQILLHHVCQDECEDIVNETLDKIKEMTNNVADDAKPSEQSCADRVVHQVEAEILGCCTPEFLLPLGHSTNPTRSIGCSNAAPNIMGCKTAAENGCAIPS